MELEALKAAAPAAAAAGQTELDLGLSGGARAGPLPITSSRMGHLWDALVRPTRYWGSSEPAEGDEVFRHLVLARIIEPTSKVDTHRVLDEVGDRAGLLPHVKRRLPVYASPLAAASGRGVRAAARWGRHRWSSTTCPRCTSRPTRVTGSGSRGSPRNAVWSRRSPSVCSPTPPGSR